MDLDKKFFAFFNRKSRKGKEDEIILFSKNISAEIFVLRNVEDYWNRTLKKVEISYSSNSLNPIILTATFHYADKKEDSFAFAKSPEGCDSIVPIYGTNSRVLKLKSHALLFDSPHIYEVIVDLFNKMISTTNQKLESEKRLISNLVNV
jgi:hypothetical protein